MSARKLAAALWRMQAEDSVRGVDEKEEQRRRRRSRGENGDRLGFKPVVGQGGHRLSCHHASRECSSEAKDPIRSPCSVNGPMNAYLCEMQSAFSLSNYEMEGATKWDPVCAEALDENSNDSKLVDKQLNTASMVSSLERELQQARAHVEELESERRISKKKLERFLKKLSDEKAAWRSREHEKVRAIIDDIKADLSRERKNRQRLEIVNSKLVNELAGAKLSVKRYMQDYEKERKTRELIEEVCNELAKEIGEDKAEVDLLKRECTKLHQDIEDERKMLQMAEVWREERVQMKLIDAKVVLDDKYSQMSQLIEALEKFLGSEGLSLDVSEMREAEVYRHAAASINTQDIKELTYEPSNPDDIFAVVEEMAMAESHEREIEPCVEYSSASHASKIRSMANPGTENYSKDSIHRLSDVYQSEVDDGGSGWETASHVEDQGSSFSPAGSIMSVNKMYRDSNASGSCAEWEEHVGNETPVTEISEVCSAPSKQTKKIKSISRLWRSRTKNDDIYKIISVDGVKTRLSDSGVSNGSGKDGCNPSDMVGWSSPDSVNPHLNRGRKVCMERPHGAQKNSLKNKLLEARKESQKLQLRQVLQQKI